MATRRIRIKRGAGDPISNNQILLAQSELAFDETKNKLFIGVGLNTTNAPLTNPKQSIDYFLINKLNYVVKTIANPTNNQKIILIPYVAEEIIIESIAGFTDQGTCSIKLINDGYNTTDVTLDSSFLINSTPDIENLFSIVGYSGNTISAIISNVTGDPTELHLQLNYR